MLNEAAYIALGGLIGTMFWLFALIYYFPRKFDRAERRIEAKIEQKEAEYKELIGATDSGIDAKALMKPIVAELSKDPAEWDPEIFQVITNMGGVFSSQVMWMVDNDEKFNQWFYDKMKGLTMNMKRELTKELSEAGPEIAKSLGVDPNILKGPAGLLEQIPEEYRWAVQLFMMYKQGALGGILGGGGGASPAPYSFP